MDVEDVDQNPDDLETSVTRSGLRKIITEDTGTQAEYVYIEKPPIPVLRDCTPEVKNACVKVSVKCGISTAMATLAVQAVCEELYHHQYYLTKEEAIERDPNLVEYGKEQPSSQPKKKRQLDERKSASKPLSNKQDYIPYKDVLPSARTLNNHKQLLAVQAEADAANTWFLMDSRVRCTLHYDTTSRSKIDGEWPSIIFSFSDKQRYVLRPIFFAYETRTQIISLILETLERLAVLVNGNDEKRTTAKELWEKINIIMTDSVENNLHIEDGIAAAFGSTQIPLHLL